MLNKDICSSSVGPQKRARVDSQDCLIWTCNEENQEDEESRVNSLIESISHDKLLKGVNISGSFISESSADLLFCSFIRDKKLSILKMPLWSVINTPSQKPLEYMRSVFESKLDSYNLSRANDQANFKLFLRMSEKGFVDIKNIKSRNDVQNYNLPDTCLQKIEEYLVTVKKKLFL